MQRCWGLTRNLQFCGRRGNWRLFCNEHRRQPLGWICFLIFTVLAGTASILSYVGQIRFRETAQVNELPATTPSPTLESQARPTSGSPAPLSTPPVSDVNKTITTGQVTITGYLVDNYFGDVERFGLLEGKVGEVYTNEQIDPFERIKSRSRATLLSPRSLRSGYSIAYNGAFSPEGTDSTKFSPYSGGGTLRLDKVGNGLAKTILTFSKKGAGVRVEAIGQEVNNQFKVSSMKEVEQ